MQWPQHPPKDVFYVIWWIIASNRSVRLWAQAKTERSLTFICIYYQHCRDTKLVESLHILHSVAVLFQRDWRKTERWVTVAANFNFAKQEVAVHWEKTCFLIQVLEEEEQQFSVLLQRHEYEVNRSFIHITKMLYFIHFQFKLLFYHQVLWGSLNFLGTKVCTIVQSCCSIRAKLNYQSVYIYDPNAHLIQSHWSSIMKSLPYTSWG